MISKIKISLSFFPFIFAKLNLLKIMGFWKPNGKKQLVSLLLYEEMEVLEDNICKN